MYSRQLYGDSQLHAQLAQQRQFTFQQQQQQPQQQQQVPQVQQQPQQQQVQQPNQVNSIYPPGAAAAANNAALLMQQLQHTMPNVVQNQVHNPQVAAAAAAAAVAAQQQAQAAAAQAAITQSLGHTMAPSAQVQQPTKTNQLLSSSSSAGSGNNTKSFNDKKVYLWIVELVYGPNREQALLELGKKRELYDDLALVLWHSFGVMTALLEEIVAVYPLLSPPQLTSAVSNRVCNALALLQCVASHPETRTPFLHAHIPLFLYPFLNTNSKQRPFEYLRLTSLGVIGALVKNDTPEVISFLLTTEIIPLCLRIMESSSELSKTVAIFVVQKILVDDSGLNYVCQTFERFSAVANVLKLMIDQLVTNPTVRLLKHVVRCYLRLSDNADAKKALKECLPEPLRDGTFSVVLRDDAATKRCLTQLLSVISQD